MRRRFSRAAALALIALLGCAHASERPPAPSEPAPPAGGAAAPTTPDTGTAGPAPAGATLAPRLDPSEEITPEELGSIPDPVPGAGSPAPIESAPLAPGVDSTVPSAPSAGTVSAGPAALPGAGTTSTSGVWRVQVFASPDRAQADKVGREASGRLGVPYVLDRNGDLVKVRLGSFAREEEAQALRERAVRNGYPGAFRVLDRSGS